MTVGVFSVLFLDLDVVEVEVFCRDTRSVLVGVDDEEEESSEEELPCLAFFFPFGAESATCVGEANRGIARPAFSFFQLAPFALGIAFAEGFSKKGRSVLHSCSSPLVSSCSSPSNSTVFAPARISAGAEEDRVFF